MTKIDEKQSFLDKLNNAYNAYEMLYTNLQNSQELIEIANRFELPLQDFMINILPEVTWQRLTTLTAFIRKPNSFADQQFNTTQLGKEIRVARLFVAKQIDVESQFLKTDYLIQNTEALDAVWNFIKVSKSVEKESRSTIERIDGKIEQMDKWCSEIKVLRAQFEQSSGNERRRLLLEVDTTYILLDQHYNDAKNDINDLMIRIKKHIFTLNSKVEAVKDYQEKSIRMAKINDERRKDAKDNKSTIEFENADANVSRHMQNAVKCDEVLTDYDHEIAKFEQMMVEIEERDEKMKEILKIKKNIRKFLNKNRER